MAATLRQSLGSCSGPSDLRLYLRLQLLLCSHLSAATSGPTGLGCRSSSSSSSSSSSASSLDLHCSFFAAATLVAVLPCSGCAPTQSSVEQAAAGPSYACGYVLGYASVDSCFAAATSVQHLRCSPARSRDLHGSYFAAATSVRPLRGSAALSLEPDCSYIAVPLAEPVAMPPAAPPSTATALQLHQCTAGADWPGLMISTNMTFSSMTFVIMLRWLTPPTATAAAATHCSGGRRLLPRDPRHSRGRLGGIEDLHHHDLQHRDLRHHDAVADGGILRWLQSASSLDLNCSYCAATTPGHLEAVQRVLGFFTVASSLVPLAMPSAMPPAVPPSTATSWQWTSRPTPPTP